MHKIEYITKFRHRFKKHAKHKLDQKRGLIIGFLLNLMKHLGVDNQNLMIFIQTPGVNGQKLCESDKTPGVNGQKLRESDKTPGVNEQKSHNSDKTPGDNC